MIQRYLLVLLALMLAASIGAFFLFVPILPAIATFAIMLGLIAMFSLGLHVGHFPTTPAHQRHRTESPSSSFGDVHHAFRDAA